MGKYSDNPKYNFIPDHRVRDEIIEKVSDFLVVDDWYPTEELAFKNNFTSVDIVLNCKNSDGIKLISEIYSKKSSYKVIKKSFKDHISGFDKKNNKISCLLHRDNGNCYQVNLLLADSDVIYNNMLIYYSNYPLMKFINEFLEINKLSVNHKGVYYLKDETQVLFEENIEKFFKEYFNIIDFPSLIFESYDEIAEFLICLPFYPGKQKYIEYFIDKKRTGLIKSIYEYIIGIPDDLETKMHPEPFNFQLKNSAISIIDLALKQYMAELKRKTYINNITKSFIESNGLPIEYESKVHKAIFPVLEEIFQKEAFLEP